MSDLAMFIGFLVFLVFPLCVAYRAYNRGYAGLALLTFLTTFVALGPFVGILTLFRTAKVAPLG